ncbi:hypothetical protein [Roseivirga pacifica]|uniref:hypothetical protein n=1 Tax=Roseivirga pacifica TaxID=1267423 RepID=UPI003BB1BEAD
MDIQATKLQLIQRILAESEEGKLQEVSKILEEPTVAYTVDGAPLSKEDVDNRLKKAEENIKHGDFLTQEEVEKKSKEW